MPRALIIFCIAGLLASFCPGQTARAEEALSWEACVREARKNHPDLVAAHEKINQARADKASTRGSLLPQISSSASKDVSKSSGKQQGDSYAYGISGRQLLFDGFKASNDLAVARERVDIASYDHQVVSSNVRLHLWSAYVGLLNAQESLKVTENILKRRQQNLGLVTLRYQGGREHKGSLLTAQASQLQAEFEVEQARRNLELYQRKLVRELGRSSFTPIVAAGSLDISAVDTAHPEFEKLVETTPMLKQLVAQKEAARFGLKSAKAGLFPQIYLDGNAGKSDSGWPPREKNWSTGISVSFPIFEGGQKQAAITKARANYAQLQADERSGRDGVILTLAETWTQWQDAAAQARVQEKFFAASTQRADIVEAQYKTGMATFNDWSIIEDALVKDQKALLEARTNAMIAEANWLQAKGETIDG